MRRFFVSSQAIDDERGQITITGADSEHMARVLRMEPGDEVAVSDNSGLIYTTRITSISPERAVLEITDISGSENEPAFELTLLQAVPKHKKMDQIVRRVTELGVSRIIPLFTERTVVRLSSDKRKKRTRRWRRIAREAGKQAKRGRVPAVEVPMNLENALPGISEDDLVLIPWVRAEVGIRSVLTGLESTPGSAAFFIGPEGGFTPAEVQQIIQVGAAPISLGPRIYRTETAGTVMASLLLYEFGEMEP